MIFMVLMEIESAKKTLKYAYLGLSVEVKVVKKLFFVGENDSNFISII